MNFEKVRDYISHISNDELIALCIDIHKQWCGDCDFSKNTSIDSLSESLDFHDTKKIEYAVVEEAHKRYDNIVLLLMRDDPTCYFDEVDTIDPVL